mmetsp:Transcript_34307/g.80967  ORF Transcript_34307/g.80967 Transcript_34307/m.80967 type:complete len:239 (+) Transcript_34307:233-949(+)
MPFVALVHIVNVNSSKTSLPGRLALDLSVEKHSNLLYLFPLALPLRPQALPDPRPPGKRAFCAYSPPGPPRRRQPSPQTREQVKLAGSLALAGAAAGSALLDGGEPGDLVDVVHKRWQRGGGEVKHWVGRELKVAAIVHRGLHDALAHEGGRVDRVLHEQRRLDRVGERALLLELGARLFPGRDQRAAVAREEHLLRAQKPPERTLRCSGQGGLDGHRAQRSKGSKRKFGSMAGGRHR